MKRDQGTLLRFTTSNLFDAFNVDEPVISLELGRRHNDKGNRVFCERYVGNTHACTHIQRSVYTFRSSVGTSDSAAGTSNFRLASEIYTRNSGKELN